MTEFLQRIAAERKNSTKRAILLLVSLFLIVQVSQAQPTTQATNITIKPAQNGDYIFTWTAGTPANEVLVVISSGTAQFTPIGPATYNANTDFNAGSDIKQSGTGRSASVMRNSNATTVTVSNLVEDTDYSIQVYEYTGGGTEAYNVNPAENNPRIFRLHTTGAGSAVTNWWTAPTGIFKVDALVWGGGGGGGGANRSSSGTNSAGGGAGGAHVEKIITVVPATGYDVKVGIAGPGGANTGVNGTKGGDSFFVNVGTLVAEGGDFGRGAAGADGTVGAKGTGALGITTNTGTIALTKGGDGAAGSNSGNDSGGGGTSGGSTQDGISAANKTGGTGRVGAGDGADGRSGDQNGFAGNTPGGGGGGAVNNSGTGRTGGDGGAGLVIINFSRPSATGTPTAVAGADINAAENLAGFDIVVPGLVASGAGNNDFVTIFQDGVAIPTAPAHQLTTIEINSGSYTFVGVKLTGADASKNITAVITNVEGNTGPASTALALNLDTASPTSAATYTAATVKNGDAQTITVTFNENLTVAPKITLAGSVSSAGFPTNVTMAGSLGQKIFTYDAAANPPNSAWTIDQTVTVTVNTGTDLAGNVVVSTPTTNTFAVSNPTTIAQITTGVNAGPTINSSLGTVAVLGFSITNPTLTTNFTALTLTTTTVPASTDPSQYFSSIKLIKSTDNSYATAGDNSIVTATLGTSTSGITFTSISSQTITAATTFNYFLEVTLKPLFPSVDPTILIAFNPATNVIFSGGTPQGSAINTINGANTAYTLHDNSPPVVNSHSINTITTSGFTYTINLTETGTTFYEVTTSASTPTGAQIKAGTGTGHIASGNFAVGSIGTNINNPISGLSAGTPYFVYSVSEDAGGNQSTPVVSDNATTLANEATISAGTGLATLSSLVITQGAELSVFNFTITDAGADGQPTRISSMKFKPGPSNFFGDFTLLIAGAELDDNATGVAMAASQINPGDIQFNGIINAAGDLGEVVNGSPKVYTLKIWFNDPFSGVLKTTADEKNLVFSIIDSDVATALGGMTSSNTNSGAGNGVIDVTPTALKFVTQPTNTDLMINMSAVTVETVDARGNRDLGTDAVSFGILSSGTLATSPTNAVYTNGFATYNNINHTAPGTGLTLTTNHGSFANPTSSTFVITAINESNIVTSAFAYPQNIQYETYQENSDISHLTTTSIVVAKFDLQDGGNDLTDTDGAPTILNSLRLTVTNASMLRRVAIYDATGLVELGDQVAAGTMTFPLNITANDNSFNSFFIRVSFKPAVTDNAFIGFTVASPTTTTATGSSIFLNGSAGGAVTSMSGNDNKIEVTAVKLDFIVQPTNTVINASITPSPTVLAHDNLNNTDVDFTAINVGVSAVGSTLAGEPVNTLFTNGLGTYVGLSPNSSGSGVVLKTNSGLTNNDSAPFEIIAKSSDILATPMPAFFYPQNIPYNTFQENADINSISGTSIVAASFDLQDGGFAGDGDTFQTNLIGLSLDLGAANFTAIRRIALYDASGTIEIPGTEQAVSAQVVNFAGFSIIAADDNATSFTVRVSFNAPVTDNSRIQFKIISATAQPSVSSQFINASAGGAQSSTAGLDNIIAVTASQLRFITQPTNTLNGVTMSSVVVHALDNLLSRDQDFGSIVGINSSGVMSPPTINALFASGIGTYNTIVHTSNAAGRFLQTNSGILTNVPSNTFNITSSNASDIVANGTFAPTNIPYLNFQENTNITNAATSLNVAQFDIQDGGVPGDADLAPTTLTSVQLDLGANFGFIRRIALYDVLGTTEIASDIVVGSQFVTFPLLMSAPDDGSASFTVRVSFTTAVTDNQQFSIKINSTTTQANTSSTFPTPAAGGATSSTVGNINRIEVTATKIVFLTNLNSPLLPLVNLSPTQQPNPIARTLDAANNLDLDYATAINIGCPISINTPSINSDNSAPNAGVYTFPNGFQYNVTGNGTLTLTSGGLTAAVSNAVSVAAGTGTAITAGAASPNTIPSTATTSGTQVPVFFFNVIDDKTPIAPSNNDGLPTLITNITISQNGAFNSAALADWRQAIAGIELHDNSGNIMNVSTAGAANVVINAASIQFLNIPNGVGQLGYIVDDATKIYDLRIYLKSSMGAGLPAIVDGKQFEFSIFNTSIGVTGQTSTLGSATSTTSGNNNVVDVLATKLSFIYPDAVAYTLITPAQASLNSDFPGVSVESVDVNGNRDLNFTAGNSTVRALTNVGGKTMINKPINGTTQFSLGLLNFASNFQYTTGANGDIVTLNIAAGNNTTCGTDYTATGICATSGVIQILASSESWIKPDPTFTFTTNVPYNNYQASNIQSVDITNLNGSFEIGRLLLSDGDADGTQGDADGAASTLTDIRIGIRDILGTSTIDQIREIAIYNNGVLPATELATHTINGTDITNGYVDFSGLNIVCPDNNLLTIPQNFAVISVRVSFKGAAATIVDKTLLRLSVEAATLFGGSQFYTGGTSPIAGYPNGYKAPSTFNFVDVIATKLVFTTQPNSFAGVNEAINAVEVQSWDANNYLDVDLNAPATVTAPTAPSANPTGTFNFVNGKLDLSSLRYTNTGNGTLLATTSAPAPVLSSTTSCNPVNVIQITAVPDLGGAGGVPPGAFATLQAGVRNVAIFGIQFRSNYNVLGEPTLTGFTVDFSRSNNSTYTLFRVLESPIAGAAFNLGLQDITAAPIGAIVTAGTNDLVVTFPTPRPFSPGQQTYTYFVVVDVVNTVNGSTPNIQLSVLDNGASTGTAGKVTATPVLGSQLVNVQGPSINFASVQPPFLVSSYPALSQDNIETSQNRIELTFSVPVFTLDGKIRLYETGAVPPNFRVLNVDNSGPQNGDYLTNPASGNAARPVKFIIPGGFLQADKQYHIIIDQGIFNASTKQGIADVNNNVFPGILYEGTLYFRTTNGAAPALLGQTSTANPPGITAPNINVSNLTSYEGTLSGTFDKKGTSYFMVVTAGSPAPTNVQIKNDPLFPPPPYPAPGNIVTRGSFPINAITTISQSGTIVPATGSFTGGANLDVWVCAETTTEANHSPTKLLSLPYGGATNYIQGTPGPTLSFLAPAAGTNAPGGAQTGVTTNRLNANLCSGSYQTLNAPIIFYEGTVQTFSIGAFQSLNLALPGGFVFDTSTDAGGTPLYANVILQGADFLGFAPVVRFLSPTVLRITFANFGNTSTDQIIISNLRIFAPTATSGDIFRIGGNALPTITDGTPIANLRANDAKLVYFDNSYSTGLGFHLFSPSPTTPANLETAIPDNAQPALVTLRPFIADSLFDHGPSTFAGQGVSVNQLNLAGVTKDTPFNISITHTDHNGCTSQNSVQFVVYDHLEGIKISETPTILTKNQGPYCAINPNFAIDQINPPTPGNKVRYINFDNLTVYNLSSLTAKYPPVIPPGAFIDPTQFGGVWDNIVTNLPQQVLPAHTPPLGGTYYDYTFDDADILGAATISPTTGLPYVYDLYWNQTSKNINYATLVNGASKATYYSGGYLGTVEFTGVFDYASNPAVSIKRRQNIDFYIPAVPVVEVVTQASFLDTGDTANNPSSGGIEAGPNNPGTLVFCEKGPLININGWPSATAGSSKGTFILVKAPYDTTVVSNLIYHKRLGITPVGFVDNQNGTAALDPSKSTILNNYQDIKILYVFKEDKSPCKSSGYQFIRVTPNPSALFTQTAVISSNTPTTTSFCVGNQINFDANTSTITPVTGGPSAAQDNLINTYDWNFGDINSATNIAAGLTQSHTFNQSQTFAVSLTTTSNWGCASTTTINNVKVGGIPTVAMSLTGVYKGQTFDFWSNGSSVSGNDFFKGIDLYQGVTPIGNKTYPAGTQPNDPLKPGSLMQASFASPGQAVIDMKVTSEIGCVNSLSLDNLAPIASGGKGLSAADDIAARTIIVLDRQAVVTGTTGYSEFFETPSTWQPWYASNSISPLTFPLAGLSWDQTAFAPTPGAGDYGTFIKQDPAILTGPGFWRTNVGNSYIPRERSALYSPSFDITALNTPMVSYNSLVQLIVSDGIIFEYSTDNLNVADPAKVWTVLGSSLGEGVGWFTDRGIVAKPGFQSGNDFGWSGATNPNWIISKHTLDEIPAGLTLPNVADNVVFRFALASTAQSTANPAGGVYEGFALDNFRIGNRTRTIMLENFSNTSNPDPNEKTQNDAIALFHPAGTPGTQVIRINYHVNFPANDPFNLDNPADPSSRALYYGVETTPKSRLDGAPDPTDRDFSIWGPLNYGTRSLALAQADIAITPTVLPGKVKIDITVTSLLGIPPNSILQVAVVENVVPFSSLSSTQKALVKTGETNFEYVIKRFLPSAAGTRLGPLDNLPSTPSIPDNVSFSFEWVADPTRIYPPVNNLSIVAFVQQEGGIREVYQANNAPILTDPGVITALEPINVEDIQVYPIPANREMHIQLPGVLSQPAAIQMIDQTGRASVVDRIPTGASSKVINTQDLAAGVYILQIDVGNGNITRKKVMVVH